MNDKIKKKKITHISRFAYPQDGGIESFIEMFNSCIKDENTDIEVYSCSNTEKTSFENGVKYNRARYLFDFAANAISPELFFKMMFIKTDVIIFHMPVIQSVIIWLILHHIGLLRYKRMIVVYHSDIIGYDKYMKPLWGIYKYFLSKADTIHVLSPQMREYSMVKEYKEKAAVIPYLISTKSIFEEKRVSEIRQRFQDKKILFAIGRHVEYKGFEYLLQAMNHVENAVLLLGSTGPLTQNYKSYVKENHLEEKVVFCGRIPDNDLENYYEACDIFVLPSIKQSETFAIVQLEAMKHAKPVINTFLNTGVNYVSIDKETGLTVEPRNPEQLASAINQLLCDDNLRLTYGKNAKQRVDKLFNIEEEYKKYKELL